MTWFGTTQSKINQKSYLGLPKLGVDNRIKGPKLSKIIENTWFIPISVIFKPVNYSNRTQKGYPDVRFDSQINENDLQKFFSRWIPDGHGPWTVVQFLYLPNKTRVQSNCFIQSISVLEWMFWFFLIFFCSVCFRIWSVRFHWEHILASFVAISPDSIGQGRTGIIHQIEGWKINKLKLFRVPLFCRLLHYCHEKWAVPDLKWPHVTFQFHLTRGAWWKF